MEWLVIADDLTGACDTGGAFTRAWQRVKVVLDLNQVIPEADVLVFNTESRSMTGEGAVEAIAWLFQSITPGHCCRVYKKIDSTLRGHPWLELEAVKRGLGCEQALVAPAFPEQGRTVLHGIVRVNGIPLEETAFASEGSLGFMRSLLSMNSHTHLLSIEEVRKGENWITQKMLDEDVETIVADAETVADLRILARSFLRSSLRLVCGSAGLARALASESGKSEPFRENLEAVSPVMVIAGSRHPATLTQIEAAARNGIQVIEPDFTELRVASKRKILIKGIQRKLFQNKQILISSSALDYKRGQELQVAQDLADLVVAVIDGAPMGGLVLTGGDIASAVCRELHCGVITLGGEILPGMIWGSLEGGLAPGLMVVTKAGGFGDDNALLTAVAFLTKHSSQGPMGAGP